MKQGEHPLRMVLAGGGTGGHVFPAIAIAEEIMRRSGSNKVLFVGTARGIEHRVIPLAGYDLATVDIEGIKGRRVTDIMRSCAKLPKSMIQSRSILRHFHPDVVIGVGGYASGPVVMAAHMMGVRTAIAEQNALPGMTNRILGKFVDRCFMSFESTAGWCAKDKVRITGNPIRAAFLRPAHDVAKRSQGFTLALVGGSQGASGINRAVVEALPFLGDLKDTLRIIHQTGGKDYETIARAYAGHQIPAEVQSFIEDMSAVYTVADLVVSRAGATTLAEINASGRASLLIPFPHAAGDHQTINAKVLVDAGAAEMIQESALDGKRLADTVRRLMNDPGKLRAMEDHSRKLGRPRAASDIVDECYMLAGL